MAFEDVGSLFGHGKSTGVAFLEEFYTFMTKTLLSMTVRWPTRERLVELESNSEGSTASLE